MIYVSCIIESDCITSMSSLHEIEDTCHNSKFQIKNQIYHFPTCYAYSVKMPIKELNLK